jgi:hypothetical protein
MQIIGLPTSTSPTRIRKAGAGHTRVIFDLSKSIRHAHRDVADALNRSINFGNQANDIPVEEVSAMITKLMDEKKHAVAYLERQKISRVTRAMKRVWDRGARVEGMGGRRKDVGGSFLDKEPTVEEGCGREGRCKVTAAAPHVANRGFASGSDGQGEFLV